MPCGQTLEKLRGMAFTKGYMGGLDHGGVRSTEDFSHIYIYINICIYQYIYILVYIFIYLGENLGRISYQEK